MPICLYPNTYVSTSRAYMLPTSTDDVFVPNIMSCIKSSRSSITVRSVLPLFLKTSLHSNVIKKPITCCDSVIKRACKCLRNSTIVTNPDAVTYDSESVNNVVICSSSFSTSPSGFVCQPVPFNKSIDKHIS